MHDISWFLFVTAALVVIVAPGQDMVLVISRGIGQGARAGLVTAAGVCTGLLWAIRSSPPLAWGRCWRRPKWPIRR